MIASLMPDKLGWTRVLLKPPQTSGFHPTLWEVCPGRLDLNNTWHTDTTGHTIKKISVKNNKHKSDTPIVWWRIFMLGIVAWLNTTLEMASWTSNLVQVLYSKFCILVNISYQELDYIVWPIESGSKAEWFYFLYLSSILLSKTMCLST